MSTNSAGSSAITRLGIAVLWFWFASLVSGATTFLVAFYGAMFLPENAYLFISTKLPILAVVSMVVALAIVVILRPCPRDDAAGRFRVASQLNLGWLIFNISLGPYFLYRYLSLPAGDFKEFYYHSYYASYAAAGFCCAIGNLTFLATWVRQRRP